MNWQTCFDLHNERVVKDDAISTVVRHPSAAKGDCYYTKVMHNRNEWSVREMQLILQASSSPYVVRTATIRVEEGMVVTEDAGLSIEQWLCMPVFRHNYVGYLPEGASLGHPFHYAGEFLRLVHACLLALQDIHQRGFVHADLKYDNICLPYFPRPFAGQGQLQVDFQRICLIDLSFSLHRQLVLERPIPVQPNREQPYQSRCLIRALESRDAAMQQRLDWSVDLYSLGNMLQRIRDFHQGLIMPAGDPGTLGRDIDQLIASLLLYDEGPLAEDAGQMPHAGILRRVSTLLQQVPGHDQPFLFELVPYRPEVPRIITQPVMTILSEKKAGQATPPLIRGVPKQTRRLNRTGRLLVSLLLLVAVIVGVWLWPHGKKPVAAATRVAVVEPARAMAVRPVEPAQSSPIITPTHTTPSSSAAWQALDDLQPDTSAWQSFSQALGRREARAVATAIRLHTKAAVVLHDDQGADRQARAFAQLQALADLGHTDSAQVLAAFFTHYRSLRQQVFASTWWRQGTGSQPEQFIEFARLNGVLVRVQQVSGLLDKARMLEMGRDRPADLGQARKLYQRVIQIEPGNVDARRALARLAK